MLLDDEEGIISKSNTQRVPVSLMKHLQKIPSIPVHFGRNAELSVKKSSITNSSAKPGRPDPLNNSVTVVQDKVAT